MAKAGAKALAQVQGPQFVKGPEEHQVSGVVRKVDASNLTIGTRNDKGKEPVSLFGPSVHTSGSQGPGINFTGKSSD